MLLLVAPLVPISPPTSVGDFINRVWHRLVSQALGESTCNRLEIQREKTDGEAPGPKCDEPQLQQQEKLHTDA